LDVRYREGRYRSEQAKKGRSVNKFLRTASTRRLLSVIAGVIAVIAAGTAVAIAAQGSGPVPPKKPLAAAIHGALTAGQVNGISASIHLSNNLIGSSEIQGPTDPLLSGGDGHIWVSSTGQLRLELYGDNGDAELVLNRTSWWISDPTTQTVYEGMLPAQAGAKHASGKREQIPTVAQIQTNLNRLAAHLNISDAAPTDVAGQPAYSLTVSPKQSRGLLGAAQLAWDAVRGIPLRFALYARGDSSPVLALSATGISYGPVSGSIFSIAPPAGYKVVQVATPAPGAGAARSHAATGKRGHAAVTGVSAVAKHLSFGLLAPGSLADRARQTVALLGSGSHAGALLTYGQGLDGIGVIERAAAGASSASSSSGSGDDGQGPGLTLPTTSVRGATAQELETALGTVVQFTRGSVSYTVLGLLKPATVLAAARGL
jgi:hypothetical protein